MRPPDYDRPPRGVDLFRLRGARAALHVPGLEDAALIVRLPDPLLQHPAQPAERLLMFGSGREIADLVRVLVEVVKLLGRYRRRAEELLLRRQSALRVQFLEEIPLGIILLLVLVGLQEGPLG